MNKKIIIILFIICFSLNIYAKDYNCNIYVGGVNNKNFVGDILSTNNTALASNGWSEISNPAYYSNNVVEGWSNTEIATYNWSMKMYMKEDNNDKDHENTTFSPLPTGNYQVGTWFKIVNNANTLDESWIYFIDGADNNNRLIVGVADANRLACAGKYVAGVFAGTERCFDIPQDNEWHYFYYNVTGGTVSIWHGNSPNNLTFNGSFSHNVEIDKIYFYGSGGSADYRPNTLFSDFTVWASNNCTPIQIYGYEELTQIINSSWNVLSNNVYSTQSTDVWNTGGTINLTTNLLSLTTTINQVGNVSCILDKNYNYYDTIALNINYNSENPGETIHNLTLIDNISVGEHCLYCSAINNTGFGGLTNSTSGCLPLTRLKPPDGTFNSPTNNEVIILS